MPRDRTVLLAVVLGFAPSVAAQTSSPSVNTPDRTAATTQSLTVPVLPETPHNYANIELPDHYLLNRFPGNPPGQSSVIDTDNTPANNPTTDEGATLGRVLFYDIKLSANGTTSCASCHVQANGFSDPNVLSVGFAGETTRRHSMGLANARFGAAGSFFWDERAETLEDQVLMPFQDPAEMGLTLDELVSIVQSQPYYPGLFADAFGDPAVTTDRISRALAQFVRSIVSVTSRYDEGAELVADPTQPFPNFTAQENLGKTLFFAPIPAGGASCSACHVTESFVNPSNAPPGLTTSTNNGLDAVSTDDLGVAETSLRAQDEGKFRVPSLKNIGVTQPYMHDGRLATLADVVEHYNSGIQPHPNLSPVLQRPAGSPCASTSPTSRGPPSPPSSTRSRTPPSSTMSDTPTRS